MYNIEDIKNKIIQGNTLKVLKQIPSNSVNMVITSPPYWGLRNYNTNPQIWDGDENCEHEWCELPPRRVRKEKDIKDKDSKQATQPASAFNSTGGDFCSKCGAWKGELGSEPTYDLYIKHLCDIFNEVKRVLTIDGTCWVNLGDTYSSVHSGGHKSEKSTVGANKVGIQEIKQNKNTDLPDKCLCAVPDRFKIEMINRGWICRNEIIWHKPNAMPSSVKDRFTVDYEKLFFFSKNTKYYFKTQYEPLKHETAKGTYAKEKVCVTNPQWSYTNRSYDASDYPQGRLKRSVWSINTKPFKEAHFAVFPEELIEIPMDGGCPELICSKCHKPQIKKIIKEKIERVRPNDTTQPTQDRSPSPNNYAGTTIKGYEIEKCNCNVEFQNGIVMDIFMGSGTTAVVATRLNRDYIGIELNPEYIEIANKRIETISK